MIEGGLFFPQNSGRDIVVQAFWGKERSGKDAAFAGILVSQVAEF